MNIDLFPEEYDDDDDYPYGHSVEDECISPTDAQQWIFDRARGQHSMSAFLANNRDIEEEDDDEVQAAQPQPENSKGLLHRRDSEVNIILEVAHSDSIPYSYRALFPYQVLLNFLFFLNLA